MAHRILVVDDEQEILAALDTHLSLIGYEVKTCDNPEEALNLISIEKFHIALLDINMPTMTGIELLRKIKQIKPTVQVIMITAYSTLEKAIDCWEAGASDYILKPFADLDAIGSIVNLTSERIRRWEDAAKKSIRK
ncbi:MAG TPA: response regulator [Bacteroidota bacterium]|jgi:two-component system response regulator HydG|nr:response regulator [Bacteroidota bacterium]